MHGRWCRRMWPNCGGCLVWRDMTKCMADDVWGSCAAVRVVVRARSWVVWSDMAKIVVVVWRGTTWNLDSAVWCNGF